MLTRIGRPIGIYKFRPLTSGYGSCERPSHIKWPLGELLQVAQKNYIPLISLIFVLLCLSKAVKAALLNLVCSTTGSLEKKWR